MLTEKDRNYFLKKISALRKSMQILEEELGAQGTPAPSKRKSNRQLLREHFEKRYELGMGGKLGNLKKVRS